MAVIPGTRVRRLIAAGAGVLLTGGIFAACSSHTDGHLEPSSGAQAAADFTDCSNKFNLPALGLPAATLANLTFDCATIKVPLDYSAPNGTTISLSLVKVHQKGVTPIGSLLINPGGPGASGVETALGLVPQLDKTLLPHFDLLGFDPRGVGLSSPISCLTDAQKDVLNAASPNILTASGFAQAKQSAANTAKLCTTKYGAALAQYDTVNTARDMDRIRQAVGDKQMNYLGFSYGTELGAQYVHLFPGKLRVAVLDGAVDPLTDDITTFANQLQGFEGAFDQFAAYCQKTAPCSSLGNPRAAVATVANKATASPIPTSASGDDRKATSSLVYTGVLSALYSRSSWPSLGAALISAEHGDSKGLLALADQYNERYDGHYSNVADANLTIGCNDSKPGPTDATIKATAASWAKRFPIFGLTSAPALFSCQQWQPKRTPVPLPTAKNSAHTVLVIGNLHDPATPYQGAKDLAKTLGNADLLSWNGEGHTSYLENSTCIDTAVNNYLIKLQLPKANTLCPA